MALKDSSPTGDVVLAVRPVLTDADLNELFSASWPGHQPASFGPKLSRSSTWIAARREGRLVGFVNVVGDGGAHAFILDATVHPDERRRGLGVRLVQAAAAEARLHGAEWLHVDYEQHLESFYQQCGFRPTVAGHLPLLERCLRALRKRPLEIEIPVLRLRRTGMSLRAADMVLRNHLVTTAGLWRGSADG